MTRTSRLAFPLLAVAAALAALTSCVGYTAHPLSKDESAFSDPNSPTAHDVMAVAARWVVRHYPPGGDEGRYQIFDDPGVADTQDHGGRFVLNVPAGMRAATYRRVLSETSRLALPVTAENIDAGLPVYHVGRVWVWGDQAKVDIFKPVSPLGRRGPGGEPLYQAVTVNLRGGFKPWGVTSHHVWTVGALPVPPLHYLGDGPEAMTRPREAEDEAASPPDAAGEPASGNE
ncbi:MAG TPA: hypothetical protein VD963_07110 [Phycisphaerales bacterium]|nr:hypothetical protein [Phycisphaerales bacterium]